METKGWIKKRDSRAFFLRHNSRGTLPRLHVFSSLLYLITSPAAALALITCESVPDLPREPAPVPEAQQDSLVLTVISPRTDLPGAADHLDLAIYAEAAPQRLEFHVRSPFSDTLAALTPPGDKRVVLIANSPYTLNYAALQAYDSMELLSCRLEDERADRPLMSGAAVVQAGRPCSLRLEPLRGEVILVSVDNGLPAGTLLENPRVRLCNVSPAAEILRTGDFHPIETVDGSFVSLPHDIGYFPVRPGIRLPCYPFDASGPGSSLTAASLEFVCEIAGTTCRYRVRLPSLQRGRTLCVELAVNSTADSRAHVYDGGPLRLESP